MKKLLTVMTCLILVGCANMQKRIVDPQGRSEKQQFSDGEACYEYAKKNSCFRNRCDTLLGSYYDSCMQNQGYKFEYVVEK